MCCSTHISWCKFTYLFPFYQESIVISVERKEFPAAIPESLNIKYLIDFQQIIRYTHLIKTCSCGGASFRNYLSGRIFIGEVDRGESHRRQDLVAISIVTSAEIIQLFEFFFPVPETKVVQVPGDLRINDAFRDYSLWAIAIK